MTTRGKLHRPRTVYLPCAGPIDAARVTSLASHGSPFRPRTGRRIDLARAACGPRMARTGRSCRARINSPTAPACTHTCRHVQQMYVCLPCILCSLPCPVHRRALSPPCPVPFPCYSCVSLVTYAPFAVRHVLACLTVIVFAVWHCNCTLRILLVVRPVHLACFFHLSCKVFWEQIHDCYFLAMHDLEVI